MSACVLRWTAIQALCVAVFGDNRQDMEESINAIIAHTTLYGLAAQKAAAEKIRDERKFASIDDLKAQLAADRLMILGDSALPQQR